MRQLIVRVSHVEHPLQETHKIPTPICPMGQDFEHVVPVKNQVASHVLHWLILYPVQVAHARSHFSHLLEVEFP